MIRQASLLAPYIKHPTTTRSIMLDMMLCMAALYLIAAFYYGGRALMLGLVSMLVCMAAELLGSALRLERHNRRDLSALVTGMMIPLMLPASIPYHIVIIADLFAILAVKYAFGGTGYNLFNPAAGGLLFVTVCWPQQVFAYPATFSNPEVFGEVTGRLTNSIAYVLSVGGTPSTDVTSVILGLHPGPMGTLNGLVLLACMLYLAARGSLRLWQPLITLGIVAAFAAFFPRAEYSSLESVAYEIFGTAALFGTVFMLSEPVTGATREEGRLLSGIVAGLLIVAFNYFGAYQQGILFVVLLMNVINHYIDNLTEKKMQEERRARYAKREAARNR